MLRVAAAHNRVLLVDWASPENLEDVLEPAGAIDWRPTDAERAQLLKAPVHRFAWPNHTHAPPPPVRHLRLTAGNALRDFPGSSAYDGATFAELYSALFRPKPAFDRQVRAARARLFGAAGARYNAMHVRMGDSAQGSGLAGNFLSRIRDVRFTLEQAVVAVACVSSAARQLPLFVATDNAALKAALAARDPARINTSVAVAPHAFEHVIVDGCTDCMVNAVQKHDFEPAAVRGIFMDLALLAGGVDFFAMGRGSNYAAWAQAWRGPGAPKRIGFENPKTTCDEFRVRAVRSGARTIHVEGAYSVIGARGR